MKLDASHPWNRLMLAGVQDVPPAERQSDPIAAPETHPDPYKEAGSHPDIVIRVWDQLGGSLAMDCRALVYGGPALVHPDRGAVFALAYGTQYVIRVLDEDLPDALQAGCKTENVWSDGRNTDLETELGQGWVFGNWLDAELIWLGRAYQSLSH